MATIYGTASLGWQLKLDYEVTQNITANTSSISMSLYVYNDNRAKNNYANDAYYIITGTKTYKTFEYGDTKQWNFLGSKTQTVNHNADGTAKVTLSAEWYSGISGSSYTPERLTLSQEVTLTTIPRASTLTGEGLTSTSNYIGTDLVIKFTAASGSFTHKLYYKVGNNSQVQIGGTIAAGIYQATWRIPTSFYAQIPNAQSLRGTIYLYTYSGSTQIGTHSATFAAYVKEADNKPDVSITLGESNTAIRTLTGSTASNVVNVVKGYSNIKATISAAGRQSATISSTKITYDGKTADYTAAVTYSNAKNNSWKAEVVDSRGFTNSTTKTPGLINYYEPTISCSVSMILDSNDTSKANATLTLSPTYCSVNFGAVSNSITRYYQYKESSASWDNSPWTTTNSNTVTINGLNAAKTYNFRAKVEDKIKTGSSAVISYTATATALPVFDFDANDFNFNTAVNVDGRFSVKTCPVITTGGSNGEIPANSSLNDYKTAGVYSCGATANAKTLSNTPWGNQSNNAIAFVMFVWYSVGATNNTHPYSYIVQELRTYDGDYVYKRRIYTSGTSGSWTFGSWHLSEAPIVDRVIETGVSNGLTYTKWSSGKSELYGKVTLNSLACTTAAGNMFRSTRLQLDFPSGLFTDSPSVTLTPCIESTGIGCYSSLYQNYTGSCKYFIYVFTSGTYNTVLNVNAFGRWK